MQALSRFGRHAARLTILLAAPMFLASLSPSATADTSDASDLLTGRVTRWGGMPADGDFRPPTFVVTGTRSQRAFFLSRIDESSPLLTAMDVDDASGRYENLTAIRWLAGHASSDGSQLRDEGKENQAEQLAVWILANTDADASLARDPAIRSRAEDLVSEALASAPRWTPPGYAQSYQVAVNNRDEHTNTLRFVPGILTVPDVPLANALFTVRKVNSNEDQFSVTTNRSGIGPTIGLRESTSAQTNLLRADIILDPGIVFAGSSGVLVTAQTIPISRSTSVPVPAASLKRAGSIFDASLASNLTPAGKRVYWLAIAAAAALGLVGLLRFLAKIAEVFGVKASADPKAVRRRRRAFIGACGILLLVLAPFSSYFVFTEFVAYGYSRPADPQPHAPTTRLNPVGEWATSCFAPDELTYPPANLIDQDYASAWVSAQDRGAGSLLAFDFGRTVALTQLSIWNGVQGHGSTFYSNGRVTTLQLLSDGGWVQVAPLDPDELGEQTFGPDQNLSPIVTRYLVLRVGGLVDTYLNAALTEVMFYGHPLPNTDRPVGISTEPAGLRIATNADAHPANTACHPH